MFLKWSAVRCSNRPVVAVKQAFFALTAVCGRANGGSEAHCADWRASTEVAHQLGQTRPIWAATHVWTALTAFPCQMTEMEKAVR
jgi:hypothetical protein